MQIIGQQDAVEPFEQSAFGTMHSDNAFKWVNCTTGKNNNNHDYDNR